MTVTVFVVGFLSWINSLGIPYLRVIGLLLMFFGTPYFAFKASQSNRNTSNQNLSSTDFMVQKSTPKNILLRVGLGMIGAGICLYVFVLIYIEVIPRAGFEALWAFYIAAIVGFLGLAVTIISAFKK